MYQALAPITKKAWAEIDERAKEVLSSVLSARRSIRVEGPKGPEFTAIAEGRLGDFSSRDGVGYSTYQVLPLVESWVEFSLNRYELDNLIRGALDVDYSSLEEAVKKSALFEEKAVYYGLPEAGIKGICELSPFDTISLGDSPSDLLRGIAEGVALLRKNFAKQPFDLICSSDLYKRIVSADASQPLLPQIKELIGGMVISTENITGAVMVPHDAPEISIVLGSDYELGYKAHDSKTVTFYLKESFTFRVLNKNVIVRF